MISRKSLRSHAQNLSAVRYPSFTQRSLFSDQIIRSGSYNYKVFIQNVSPHAYPRVGLTAALWGARCWYFRCPYMMLGVVHSSMFVILPLKGSIHTRVCLYTLHSMVLWLTLCLQHPSCTSYNLLLYFFYLLQLGLGFYIHIYVKWGLASTCGI